MKDLSPLEVLALYPHHDYTLKRLFESRVIADPQRPFLIFKGKTWSWGEFNEAIERAGWVLTSLGIRRGDRVAIMATNSDAHVLVMFALARIAAIIVPVNPEFGVTEARYVVTHAGVSGMICSSETLKVAREACSELTPEPWFVLVDGIPGDIPQLDELLAQAPAVELPNDVTPDDTFAIIYSSGTTGFPKGVLHSQRNFVLSAEVHLERTHLQPNDRALCILPMFHINALFYSLGAAVTAGASLVIAPRFSASQFWRLAADTGATQVAVMMAVSTILARRPRSEYVPEHRIRLINGSGFTKENYRVFNDEFGITRIIEGYGMTEIPAAFGNPYAGPHKRGSMGKPAVHPDSLRPWMEARVVDDAGNDVSVGAPGELVVRVPNIMQGYYRDPEQTAAAYRDGWFLTGDLVRKDADGYYFFVARKKDIIRRRGENIAGAELDRIIGEHPSVAEAAAIPVDSELGEDEIMAVVVPKAGMRLSADEVRKWCGERLAAHKIPRFVVFVDALPHTPTHKVAKHLLRRDLSLRAKADDLQA